MKRLMWFLGAAFCGLLIFGGLSVPPITEVDKFSFIAFLGIFMFLCFAELTFAAAMLYCLYKTFFEKD